MNDLSARKRIPTLDGWRGVAILLVLVSHISAAWGLHRAILIQSIGKHGVTVFFVLSGYLITHRLLQELDTHGTINLKNFYIRRFFRLMPAAWAYLLFLTVIAIEAGDSLSIIRLPACLFFFRNFVDQNGRAGMTVHFWTLSIEEQFYFLWPAILLTLGRKRASIAAGLMALGIAAWRFHLWTYLSSLQSNITFETQYRADSLLVGCLAALLLPKLVHFLRGWMILPLLAFLAFRTSVDFTLVPLYESVAIAFLLLATSLHPQTLTGKLLDSKPIAWVGHISYSIYLWQALILLPLSHSQILFAVPIIFLCAIFSYYLIETGFTQKGRLLTMPRGPASMVHSSLKAV